MLILVGVGKPASKIGGLIGSQSVTMVRFHGSGIAADFADKAGNIGIPVRRFT